MAQQGSYGAGELEYVIEHDGTVLLEVQDMEWKFTKKIEAQGKGLGNLVNTYYKESDAAEGTFKLKRNMLARADKGMLFSDLLSGARYILQEPVAASSTTYTVAYTSALVSILEIRLSTANIVLREGLDYTVAYSTGVITFAVSTPEAAVVKYIASNRRNKNFIINGGFEDSITGIWTAFATGAVVRDTSNAYVEGNALKITPSVANDGARYNISMSLHPGRQYRIIGKAKAAAAEVLAWFWNDGTTDQAATAVSGATLTTTFTKFEATFTPTKAVVPSILVKDSKASPGVFYIDELALLDDTTGNAPTLYPDPMDGALATPIMFNILIRRKVDGVVIERLINCTSNSLDKKSGKPYTEDVDGMFLRYATE